MSTPLKVLFVEDSQDDVDLVLRELRLGGFEPTWDRVDDRPSMTEALDRESWDLIISDHQMPRFSAPAALSLLKERNLDIPFFVVSGLMREEEAVVAMRAGARDYFVKDKLARLAAAVERELQEVETRRAQRRAEEKSREAEQTLAHLARRDRVTGLPNRAALEEQLEEAIREASVNHATLGLLHIRLNRFHEIEHTLGHSHSDTLVRSIVERLQGLLRAEGALAHLTTNEFALLIPRADAERAIAMARSVLSVL